MDNNFVVAGAVAAAPFTLKLHRGEGMVLLAMNWRTGKPPLNFVGFAIENRPPGATAFFPLKNRLTFDGNAGTQSPVTRPPSFSTLIAPIQKFRWVHFPHDADASGAFTYRVTPVFMDDGGHLSYGVAQTADVVLADETYPGILNVAFTRGFISSQAFVDTFAPDGKVQSLLPAPKEHGTTFVPKNSLAEKAYTWMGFEARKEILATLDAAIQDPDARVGIVAFDFNLPEIIDRVKTLGKDRVRVIIDNSKDHTGASHDEDGAEKELAAAGIPVRRQHMKSLQHNKTIVVDGPKVKRAIFGSTNMSWRGFYVQSNNAVIVQGASGVKALGDAFEQYWNHPDDFPKSASAGWVPLHLTGVDASVTFSPHNKSNSVLDDIGKDILAATSSIFYSLAFLNITPGVIRDALEKQTSNPSLFVAGISDKKTGVDVASGSSNAPPAFVKALDKDAPEPFKSEPTGGGGVTMHHKFIVIDFDKPTARVYLGSYNMSNAADGSNGENLMLIKDQKVATSYMVEALSMIDHYVFRIAQADKATAQKSLRLQRPPKAGEKPWWDEDWTDQHRVNDRLLFS